MELLHKEITQLVLGAFYNVYSEIGGDHLESVYEACMIIALRSAGVEVERQVPIAVRFRGLIVGDFKADLVVERKVLVELKAARKLDPAHEAQVINYLKASDLEVGLLLNFGLEANFRRLVYGNDRKYRPHSSLPASLQPQSVVRSPQSVPTPPV